MENSKIIEIIRLILEGYKHSDKNKDGNKHYLHEKISDTELYLWNCDYLLNQVIRHYNVPQNNWYYSEGARNLWNQTGLALQQFKKTYDTYLVKVVNKNFTYEKYSGNGNTHITCYGDFRFNNVFHIEHIVPITKIIEELTNLSDLSDENIIKILDKICCARILKEENVNLHNKFKRDSNFYSVYHNLYLANGIKLYSNLTDEEVK